MNSQFFCEISVTDNDGNVRLDRFISLKCGMSRSQAQIFIINGNVKLYNDIMIHKDHLIKSGEVYRLFKIEKRDISIKSADISLSVVYEDNDIMIINKPANMVVHPGIGTNDDTLLNAVFTHCLGEVEIVDRKLKPAIVHRLDKDTTGLIIVAKNDSIRQLLADLFFQRKVKKEYLAIVWGEPLNSYGIIENNIAIKRNNRELMTIVKKGGKYAMTEYHVIQSFGIASLVKCILHTGRTHQLRLHMSHIGHSIVGDQKYGKNSAKILRYSIDSEIITSFKRQALHSHKLSFIHPITQKNVEFISNIPDDMKNIVNEFISIRK